MTEEHFDTILSTYDLAYTGERKKENYDFKCHFLDFYKAELNRFVFRRVRAFCYCVGFCHSFDVLSPLPIVYSQNIFNYPHPYIEIATAISDNRPTG